MAMSNWKWLVWSVASVMFFAHVSYAQNRCINFLTSRPTVASANVTSENLEGEALFKAFANAMYKLENFKPEKPTAEELKKFRAPSKLMTILKRVSGPNLPSAEMSLWMALERHVFNKPELETVEFVRNVEKSYVMYTDIYKEGSLNKYYDIAARGKLGVIEGRQAAVQRLKTLEFIFSETLGERINLLEESGWLRIMRIEDLTQFNQRLLENAQLNRGLNGRIASMLQRTEGPTAVYNRLTHEFFGEGGIGIKSEARDFLVRTVNLKNVEEMIRELRLDKKKEEAYLNDLNFVSQGFYGKEYRTHFGMALVLFKAYLEVYDSIPGFTNVPLKDRFFTNTSYLAVQTRIHHNKILRAVIEEQYSEFIEKSDILNQRRNSLELQLEDILMRYPRTEAEIIKLWAELKEVPQARDFESDLVLIESRLSVIERNKDHMFEQVLKEVRNESIESFADLNLRWSRLIPNKTYSLRGVDYRGVRFNKEVVEYFADHPVNGTRFLTALAKSYVAVKNASGLRRLQNIHEDFRDIKVLKAGAKIRIVGKLVGDQIHFFHVYHSDKPYNDKAMKHLIENYRPE